LKKKAEAKVEAKSAAKVEAKVEAKATKETKEKKPVEKKVAKSKDAKPEVAKKDAAKPEPTKADATKADATKADATKADAAKAPTTEASVPKKRKKGKKNIPSGIVHVLATFNNTLVTITDLHGNTVSWSSAGVMGFKGARKSTPFAAQITAEDAVKKAMEHGMRSVQVLVSGPGSGRESAIRACQTAGLKITVLRDVTPIPHNGCRPPKRRRI